MSRLRERINRHRLVDFVPANLSVCSFDMLIRSVSVFGRIDGEMRTGWASPISCADISLVGRVGCSGYVHKVRIKHQPHTSSVQEY